MKKLKRLLAVMLCALMSISVVACGGGSSTPDNPNPGPNPGPNPDSGSGDKTVINIQGYEAGVNLDWLRGLAGEFEALYANQSFEPGKTGVEFKIEGVSSTDASSMLQSNIHMYVMHGASGADTGRSLAEKQFLVSIDDVVSMRDETRYDDNGDPYQVSIREKVLPNYYNSILSSKNVSSNQDISTEYKQKYGLDESFQFNTCYAMPSFGLQNGGLSYDVYNFNCYGLYLADPEWAEQNSSKVEVYPSKFGTATFIKGSNTGNLLNGAKKACGNDGVFGTFDDGLPTSMEEFFILCDYMKSKKGISPLTAYGASLGHRNRIARAFEVSLSGADTYQARYTYDSNGSEVAVVSETTPFSAENAFTGINYIKKANIENKVITLDNGYLATRTAAKYYSIAMVQIAYQEGWYSAMSSEPNNSHLDAEEQFILNGIGGRPKCGMLIEGNYWYNEARRNGSIQKFATEAYNDRDAITEPDIKWMSLPTKLYGTVTEGNGTPYNSIVEGTSPIVINARYKNDANIIALLKLFMKYIHSDEALSYYTGSQGVYRAGMDYEVSAADRNNLSSFQKSYLDMYAAREKTVETAYLEGLERQSPDQVDIGSGLEYFTIYQGGANKEDTNAKNLFLRTTWSSSDWASREPIWSQYK